MNNRYRRANIQFKSDPSGIFVRNPDRASSTRRLIDPHDIKLLSFCVTFKTLSEHALAYARFTGNTNTHRIIEISDRLSEYARDHILVSESELMNSIKHHPISPESSRDHISHIRPISIVGIPTCNRPDNLRLCLESFISNAIKYNHRPEFVIADDSDDQFMRTNAQLILELTEKFDIKITHLHRQQRARMAQDLSRRLRISSDIISFAISGDDSHDNHTGALRNSILLYGCGKKVLFVDDDTICKTYISPTPDHDVANNNLIVTSSYNRDYYYFRTHEDALKYFDSTETDYIGVHESMLGQTTSRYISSAINKKNVILDSKAGSLSDKLFAQLPNIFNGNGIIATTATGSIGDSWARSHSGGSIEPLNRAHNLFGTSLEEFEHNKTTPYVSRLPESYFLYKGITTVALNLGIDTALLTPPFAPIFRAQDGIFGILQNKLFPHHFSGHIPIAIEHRRSQPRRRMSDDFEHVLTIGMMTVSLISSYSVDSVADDGFRDIGSYLSDLANRPVEQFETIVRSECLKLMRGYIQYMESVLAYSHDAPDYWQNDVGISINKAKNLLHDSSSLNLFWDVGGWPPSDINSWMKFSNWIFKFSRIIKLWPELYHYTRQSNQK